MKRKRMISPVRAVLMELSMKTTKYCSVTNAMFPCTSLATESRISPRMTGARDLHLLALSYTLSLFI